MADYYFKLLVDNNNRHKEIKREIEDKIFRVDKGLELLKRNCHSGLKLFGDLTKELEEKFSHMQFRCDEDLEAKVTIIENETLRKLNKPFIADDLVRTGRKIKKMKSLKVLSLDKRNKEDLFNEKEFKVGILDKFYLHFGRMLLKNFKCYQLRRNWDKFILKVRSLRSLMKLFSRGIISRLSSIIIKRILLLQKRIRWYLFRRKLNNLYFITKKVLKIKRKFVMNSLRGKVKLSKSFKKKINIKYLLHLKNQKGEISSKLNNIDDTRIYKAVKFSEYQLKYKVLLGFIIAFSI